MKNRGEIQTSILITIGICFLCSTCGMVAIPKNTVKKQSEYLSPTALEINPEDSTLYIAEATAQQIAIFDIPSGLVTGVITLPDNPSGLVLSPDGSRLYVSSGSSDGTVTIIETSTNKVVTSIPVGHTPCSPILSPDGNVLFVCNRFDNSLSVIDTALEKEIATIPMMYEPIAADITRDGRYLFVANHLPTNNQIEEYITDGGYMDIQGYSIDGQYASKSVVVAVDVATYKLKAIIQLPKGSTSLKGICSSPDGKYIYVTHILARYKQPTRDIKYGSINTNALSIIDSANMELNSTVLLDDIEKGAANPWGVICSENGEFLCVTHAGTHELSIIDRGKLHAKLNALLSGTTKTTTDDLLYDLTFMNGLRQRIQLKGNGPRGITTLGKQFFAAEYFTDSLSIVSFDIHGKPIATSVLLGPTHPQTPARKGEMYFNDANLCFQTWQSCASCHPDGRPDVLNWDLLNDGEGNPKNTKNLLLSHQTPPAMITGVRKSAEDAVRAGFEHILFQKCTEACSDAIDTYLKSLEIVPSPYLVNGKLSRNAKHGRKIFKKCGCIECHPPPLYTDLKKYAVGTGNGNEKNSLFDTPTLIEIWRTAPYLYNGKALSIFEVLTTYNRRNKHGKTSHLNYEELNDLIEFILSL